MNNGARVGPARALWRFSLRQRASWREAHIAKCRNSADAQILRTLPIHIDPHSNIEIHCLTCERDYLDLMWCLKTFRHYADRSYDLFIHDDGSLSPSAHGNLRSHFPGVTIVSKLQADERLTHELSSWPASWSFRQHLPLARRIFDFPVFAKRRHYLVLDSDVLYFARPGQMLDLVDHKRPFFMSDYQDAYICSREQLETRYGVRVVPAFNTGISFFTKDMLQHHMIEQYCEDVQRDGLLEHPWTEQTLFAIIFSQQQWAAERLSKQHGIAREPISATTVSHHFVNDGSRGLFYTKGVRRLRQSGFLRALAKKAS